MKFNKNEADLFVFENANEIDALSRTTDLCFAAHQDDIEIMAYGPIVNCYDSNENWFTGVVVTDGAGSPRSGIYKQYTDDEMKQIRVSEQRKAAAIGNYSAQIQLGYKSSEVKEKDNLALINEIKNIVIACSPSVVYTHNFADKHDTHVAVAINVIKAIRLLPIEQRPKKVYSMEVWRGFDWLCDEDKTVFDTHKHPNLANALLGVFDSQIAGGKRYDLATIGRRNANATFFASHEVDSSDSINYGLDITELVNNENLSILEFINKYIENFKMEVKSRLEKLEK